ncbi:Mobile element protein [Azospirillum largimobile]
MAKHSSWRTPNGNRGASQRLVLAAAGAVIHSGTWVSVPSGCSTTSMTVPRKRWRRTTPTRSPHRGWKG